MNMEEGCPGVTIGTFKPQVVTADGRPWYEADADILGGLFGTKTAYLYYDRDCDGKGGNSKNSYPQWTSSDIKPITTKLEDVGGKGCLGDGDDAGKLLG